jgi:hypothetical protein
VTSDARADVDNASCSSGAKYRDQLGHRRFRLTPVRALFGLSPPLVPTLVGRVEPVLRHAHTLRVRVGSAQFSLSLIACATIATPGSRITA